MKKAGIIVGLLFAVVAGVVAFVSWKLGQIGAGICLRTGVPMSEVDLRREVIASLVEIGLDNIRHQDADHYRGGLGLKVTGPLPDSDIAKALFDLKNRGLSFAEEFGAKEVSKISGEPRADTIGEPFLLLSYSTYGGYTVMKTASQDIIPVSALNLPAGVRRPGFMDRLRGFGVHYYEIPMRQFIYDCCSYMHDRWVHPSVSGAAAHYWEAGKDGSVIIGDRDVGGVAYVSNCGEILTRRSARGFKEIKWIRRN